MQFVCWDFEPEIHMRFVLLVSRWCRSICILMTLLRLIQTNRLGGYLATRHLIQSGRKRIAMLSGSSAHYSIQERVHGFRKALYDAKMLANPELEIAIPHHAK